jgi:hypothetical protein
MRDFSSFSNHELLKLFNYLMAYDPDDFGKTVRQLAKSYPNDFWPIYREVEHRQIYEKPDDVVFVGIVGTRKRDVGSDLYLIINEFNKIQDPKDKIVIVSGLCPKGGDRFATMVYSKYKTMKLWFPAEWSLGRHAGFVRNTEIARWSDWLITTPSSDRKGGTEDTIKKFTRFHGNDRLIIV